MEVLHWQPNGHGPYWPSPEIEDRRPNWKMLHILLDRLIILPQNPAKEIEVWSWRDVDRFQIPRWMHATSQTRGQNSSLGFWRVTRVPGRHSRVWQRRSFIGSCVFRNRWHVLQKWPHFLRLLGWIDAAKWLPHNLQQILQDSRHGRCAFSIWCHQVFRFYKKKSPKRLISIFLKISEYF